MKSIQSRFGYAIIFFVAVASTLIVQLLVEKYNDEKLIQKLAASETFKTDEALTSTLFFCVQQTTKTPKSAVFEKKFEKYFKQFSTPNAHIFGESIAKKFIQNLRCKKFLISKMSSNYLKLMREFPELQSLTPKKRSYIFSAAKKRIFINQQQ